MLKRKFCLFCFVYFLSFLSINGNNRVDSIRSLLSSEIEDSVKISLYTELADLLLQSSHTEALDYYYSSLKLSKKCSDTAGIVYGLLGICDVHSLLGEYKQALNFTMKAHHYAQNDYDLLASCYSRMAIEYFNLEEYDLSIKHDRLSLKYNKLINDSLKIAYDLHNIGTYYLGIELFDSARYYYQFSNSYLKQTKDPLPAYNNSRTGFSYSYEEEYNKALQYHYKALEIFSSDSSYYDLAMEENYIASAYFNLRRLKEALKHAFLALEYSKKLNNHDLLKENYFLLYDIYNYKKDYKNALKYVLLQKAYSDSLEIRNRETVIQSIKTKYEFEQQKRVLEATNKSNVELSKQKKLFFILSIVAIGLLIVSVVVLFLRHKEHQKNRLLTKELEKVNNSLRKLLSIIGHDLKSSIGNLRNFTRLIHYKILDKESIDDMITKIVPMVDSTHDLLENLLAWTSNNDGYIKPVIVRICIKDIVQYSIKQLSHLATLKKIKIKEDLEQVYFYSDKNVLLIVLRNIITNAIKFSPENSIINVSGRVNNSLVEFSVKDEGIGMTKEEIDNIFDNNYHFHAKGTKGESGSGIGLKLCNSIIMNIGGEIKVESTKSKGSTFTFYIPNNIEVRD